MGLVVNTSHVLTHLMGVKPTSDKEIQRAKSGKEVNVLCKLISTKYQGWLFFPPQEPALVSSVS